MGYRPPPPPPEYGTPCDLCFPAGKTPYEMIAFFSGIEPCEGFDHEKFGSIPTSVILTKATGCWWYGNAPPSWYCSYETTATISKLWLAGNHVDCVFHGETSSPCVFSFSNIANCEEPWAYIGSGGNGTVLWRADTLKSIKAVCEAVGMPNDLDTKFDVTPIDATHNLFHFYRAGISKDLLVKIDMTAL